MTGAGRDWNDDCDEMMLAPTAGRGPNLRPEDAPVPIGALSPCCVRICDADATDAPIDEEVDGGAMRGAAAREKEVREGSVVDTGVELLTTT